jgi:hypothetical protein
MKIFKVTLAVIGSLILVLVFCLLGLKTILDQTAIKTLVKEKIEHVLRLQVNYSEIDTVIFPFPGIQITGLEIKDEGKQVCLIEDMLVQFDLSVIWNQNFQIRSIQISDGELVIERALDGSFPLATKFKSDAEEIEEGREKMEEGPRALLRLLPKQITIQNIKILYFDMTNQTRNELSIEELELSLDKNDLSSNIKLLAGINGNSFSIVSTTSLNQDDWTFVALRTKSQISFDHFDFVKMGDFIQIFPKADLQNASLNMNLMIEKDSDDMIRMELLKFVLQGVKAKKGDLFPPLGLVSTLDLQASNSSVNLNQFAFHMGEHSELEISGKFFKDQSLESFFAMKSGRFDLDRLLSFAGIFSKTDLSQSAYFRKDLASKSKEQVLEKKPSSSPNILFTFDMKKLVAGGKHISYIKGPLNIKENRAYFKNIEIGIFEGNANVTGNYDLLSNYLHVNARLSGINVEKAIGSATRDKLLKGRLRSDVVIDLNFKKSDDMMRYLKLKSTFHVDKGQLLGYANFIKPVAEVGKLFNFNGSKGESTEFESIDGSVSMVNKNILLHSFEMRGVGLNATGSGVYNDSRKIDMKFTVSLAGYLGKAVKLPIIYRGFYGKNFAYIDPVWMATVYTGTVLGGPLGTVLGSMAGSQASDRIDQTMGTVQETFSDVKGFFFGENDEVKKKKAANKK